MQVVKKVLMIFFIIWFAFVLFMPKQNLYYKLEQELAAQGIKINEGKISEGLFTLQIDEAVVYIKGIDLIHVKQASCFSLLFYSSIDLKGIVVDKSLSNMIPTNLTEVTLSHVIWSPRYVSVSGHGTFGVFEGKIDLVQQRVHLSFREVKNAGTWKRRLKKGKKGLFYETSF